MESNLAFLKDNFIISFNNLLINDFITGTDANINKPQILAAFV